MEGGRSQRWKVCMVEYVSSAHPPLQRQLPARGTFVHVVSIHLNVLQMHVVAWCVGGSRLPPVQNIPYCTVVGAIVVLQSVVVV